ncbi:MAG: ribosome maturation factor RimP [Proteobacteria bacterium]|nr:ribosome maturation factor RimP [Pseudomonadota bacterium]
MIQDLTELVAPMAEAMGLSLWGIEFSGDDGHPVLRIYVDKEGGVVVGQCVTLSRDISVILDAEDLVPGRFNLEVSSPGLDRPFFTLDQMRGYEGQHLKVRLNEPFEGSRNFIGTLKSVGDTQFSIILEDGGDELTFDFSEVNKIRIRYQFPVKNKGKKA